MTAKPFHAVTSIKQSPVLTGHLFLVLSLKILGLKSTVKPVLRGHLWDKEKVVF
jgi:hypothetical protein